IPTHRHTLLKLSEPVEDHSDVRAGCFRLGVACVQNPNDVFPVRHDVSRRPEPSTLGVILEQRPFDAKTTRYALVRCLLLPADYDDADLLYVDISAVLLGAIPAEPHVGSIVCNRRIN